ncbi:MAG: hypothetical protein GY802_20900 [Gammaproteobacteria bacterium]|nr:hypothetical protein [Gammaproteobacteria bacterium]
MSIFNEAQQLEELSVIGKALIKYAISIEPGLVFERQGGWWLPSIEKNFIGFQFQWTDMVSINLSLYGSPDEQFRQEYLTIRKGKFNYSRCRITDENQLMAATVCIWRAHQLFHKERNIETGGLILLDEAETEHTEWLRPRPQEPKLSGHKHFCLSETSEWYNEVRDFMKKNRIIDSSTTA